MKIKKRTGIYQRLSLDKILNHIRKLCNDTKLPGGKLKDIDPDVIANQVVSGLYDGVESQFLNVLAAGIALAKSIEHPSYADLALRITLDNMYKDTEELFSEAMETLYENDVINDQLIKDVRENKDLLNETIDYSRDYNLSLFGYKTLEKGYLAKVVTESLNGESTKTTLVERPQHMWMRVSLGLHKGNVEKAIETYNGMSQGYFTHATPTLFNSGTKREQNSSCFLLTMNDDSIDGIFKTVTDCAKISKWSGGLGVSISDIRAKGSKIRGTNGKTDGIIPMLKVFNETARYVNQGGKRKGSIACYIEPWHADIFEFLDLKKNQGIESERARDLFLAMWIPDLFMKKVEEKADWYLMCPDQCAGLTTTYGDEFEDLYNKYVSEGKYRKKVKAMDVWEKICESQIETGVPYLGYKDAVNRKNMQKNLGVIKGSNLCVRGDTPILTDKGYFEIEKLVNEKVNVWNGNEWSETIINKTGEDKELIKIEFSDGDELVCTEYHKFYIGSDGKEVRAHELKEGMKLIKCSMPVIKDGDPSFHLTEIGSVPINCNLETKLKWVETIFDPRENAIHSFNKMFIRDVRRLLNTLGLNCNITDNGDGTEKIVLNSTELYKLQKLGAFKLRKIEEKQNNENEITVKNVTQQYCRGDTYCFNEKKRHMGVFNGYLTGQCIEVVLFTSKEEVAVCFTGDTTIITKNGIRRIDECDGEEVLSYFNNDIDLKHEETFNKAKLICNGEKDVYKLNLHGNSSIKSTENHLYLTRTIKNYDKKEYNYKWKQLKDLKEGEFIARPNIKPLPGYNNKFEADIEYVTIGWMVGDGWQCKSKTKGAVYGVCFGPNEEYSRDVVINQLNKWLDDSDFSKGGYLKKTTDYYTDKNGVYSWSSSKKNFITNIIEKYGLKPSKAQNKCIPDKIKKSDPKKIASFLSGIFSADGTVYLNKRKDTNVFRFYVGYSSSSLQLLEDIQNILRLFGIQSRILWSYLNQRDRYQGKITIENMESIRNFNKYIGFYLSNDKQSILEMGLNVVKPREVNREYAKIKSIEYVGIEMVYDLNVEETHNFIAEGLVVHNCNLSSIALPKYVEYNKETKKTYFNFEKLGEIARIITRNLNNVIDYNYYPIPETEYSNKKNRPIGIGTQGLADVYFKMKIPFDSESANQLNKKIFETIQYYAASESIELAKVHGHYESYQGSPWSEGNFQHNLWGLTNESLLKPVKEYKSGNVCINYPIYDWDQLKSKMLLHGIRNSVLTAQMPTGVSAQLLGNTESTEAITSNIYMRKVLAGEFPVVNKYLVAELMSKRLWTPDIVNEIIKHGGSIQNIEEIPDSIKEVFKIVWEIKQRHVIDQSAGRAPFICQTQSLNLFIANPNMSIMSSMAFYAWKQGLKTGQYYLRSKPAAQSMQFTVTDKVKVEPVKEEEVDCQVCSA